MIKKELNAITLEDIQYLVDNSISEIKTLEYKRDLNISNDKDKKEFLADVSSFSNTNGGDLIFGINEIDGIASSIEGIISDNYDALKLRIESIIRDGIQPRINVGIHLIIIKDNLAILILRIQKSWNSPHRVIFQGHDKFYSRNSAGKYSMDTQELRNAFNLANRIEHDITVFKETRISNILNNNAPLPLSDNGAVIIHIIPLDSFNNNYKYAIKDLDAVGKSKGLLQSSGWNSRINLNGFLTYYVDHSGKNTCYTQYFRNGIVEIYDDILFRRESKVIPSYTFEDSIIKYSKKMMEYYSELQISVPIYYAITLIKVRNYKLGLPSGRYASETEPIEVDKIELPDMILSEYNFDFEKELKSTFDVLWNACGFEYSCNYTSEGKWISN